LYLLDNRYFRSDIKPNDTPENRYKPNNDGTILGEEQWQWLDNEIKESKASLNIFVSGIQVIPDDQPYEKWGNFPKERQRLLDLIEKYNVKNPLILSGDRHLAELSEYTYQNFKGTITELTTSGLTHSFTGVKEYNAYRLGELYDGKNFGMIKVFWGGSKVMCKLFIFDIDGNQILEHGIIGDY
jgi:alkaline phosphatase D